MTVNEEKTKPAKSKTDFTKNFPLPEEKGSPCFVTVNIFCYFIAYYCFLTFADFTEFLTFEVFAYSY